MSATPQPSELFSRLSAIIAEITSIPKSGHNDFHGYDYVTANDLINAVRDKLAKQGIFIFTSIESQEVREIVDTTNPDPAKHRKNLLTLVTLKHTFCCAATGETFSVLSQGQGSDSSDKGGYKAITGAMKYFIYKCFMIPTDEDGSELELETKRNAPPPAAAGTTTPAGKREAAPRRGELKWREVKIHFGVYKDKKLGDLTDNQLRAWFNWKPNPRYEKDVDRLLLSALVSAQRELADA